MSDTKDRMVGWLGETTMQPVGPEVRRILNHSNSRKRRRGQEKGAVRRTKTRQARKLLVAMLSRRPVTDRYLLTHLGRLC